MITFYSVVTFRRCDDEKRQNCRTRLTKDKINSLAFEYPYCCLGSCHFSHNLSKFLRIWQKLQRCVRSCSSRVRLKLYECRGHCYTGRTVCVKRCNLPLESLKIEAN
jgi:hypothetical protein